MKPDELGAASLRPTLTDSLARTPAGAGQAGHDRVVDRLTGLSHGLLATYLACLLVVPDVQTALAGLTCLTAFAAVIMARARGVAPVVTDAGATWPSMRAFLLPALAWGLIVLFQVATGHAASRVGNQFAIIVCIAVLGLSRVPAASGADCRRWLLPGAALGAIGAGLLAAWQVGVEAITRPYGWLGASSLGTGSIKFGDLSALLALLALVLVQTSRGWRRMLGLVGIAGGTTALALSQARGGLLGVLIAVMALALALALAGRRHRRIMTPAGRPGRGPSRRPSPRRVIAMASIGMVAISLMGLSMHQRFADIEPQIERFQRGDAESETGQRIALWQAAVRAGLHSPLTGAGLSGGFARDIERQFAAGDIAPTVKILYGQPHNEYLNGLASAGIPGFLTIVLLFWWPVLSQFRRLAGGLDSAEARAALVVTASFAGFALTDSMFDRQITIIAYFLLSAWLLRMAAARVHRDG